MKRFKQLIYAFCIICACVLSASIAWHYGAETGYVNGKQYSVQLFDRIVNYEILTTESIQAIDSIQNRLGVEFKIDGE